MPIHNEDIARTFDTLADVLQLQEANPFRIRAYRNASRTIRSLGTEVGELIRDGKDLDELPGIGEDLAAKIVEIVETGKLSLLDEARRSVPKTALELCNLPGIGPKRALRLCQKLDLRSLEDLRRAASDGQVRKLRGFGQKSEKAILNALATVKGRPARFLLNAAQGYADAIVGHLKQGPSVDRVVVAGSFRRSRETVGDLDILVTGKNNKAAVEWLTHADDVVEVVSAGPTRGTVRLRSGLQVDVRAVAGASFGAALVYFTGSKAHNIAIRRIAQERGLKINEYGVFRGRTRIAGETEESVYAAVGLPLIPPELREDRGEIEAARLNRLPKLVELGDIRGDLHTHTKATDGLHSLAEMAKAAAERGREYIAVTDHSQHATITHGLSADRLLRQIDEIDALNAKGVGLTILKGIEVDILDDGNLDLPDDVLSRLDLVVGAVHSRFDLPREAQTRRILCAMDHPHFSILAHPTGRLLETREPYDVDMDRIIRAARQRGCFLELNAQPDRLDLNDIHCQMAKAEGVLISIATDAHRTTDFGNLRFGVAQARRGWLEKKDVLNARPLRELRRLLAATM
jgi:DNA polymerase (family 10)